MSDQIYFLGSILFARFVGLQWGRGGVVGLALWCNYKSSTAGPVIKVSRVTG